MPQKTASSLRFREKMSGWFAAGEPQDLDRSSFETDLSIEAKDFGASPSLGFSATGEARAPALSPDSIHVIAGTLQWLVDDPSEVDARRIVYRLKLSCGDRRRFFFEGFKRLHEGLPRDFLAEMSTLYFTVYAGDNASAPVAGTGVLRSSPKDILRALASIRAPGIFQVGQIKTLAQLGRSEAGALLSLYGGPVAPLQYADAAAPPRQKRPLRAPRPEIHYFNTVDGVELRLMRYQGGSKGPVILTHGIGVSSLIFRIDTIETNLVEFLTARGFDVWALDYRGSIELAAHNLQFSADDVAAYDYPAAVERVKTLTGASGVQMVVHCFGSVSFFMAMLKGLQGVRSAVSSQVAMHLATAPITELKCGLYIPEVFDAIGMKSLSAFISSGANWKGKLDEAALRFYPTPENQLCTSPVCHRITFLYSQVFEHEQLNAATHGALDEMFGAVNIRAFEHLSRMVRTGHIVTAEGKNDYLPCVERLAIPIAFISGGNNRCFLPESTQRTYDLLCEKNGRALYTRTVAPRYGHADSILGKNAARDVYPAIARHLEETA